MFEIKKEKEKLNKELGKLRILKTRIQKSRKSLPKGTLRSEMSRGKYPQFYFNCEEEKGKYPHGRYLKKEEIELAREYAQEEYNMLMLKEIEKKEKELESCIRLSESRELSEVYYNLSSAKRKLIAPYILPDEEYIIQWRESLQGCRNSFPISNGFLTEQGDLVRSKSEKMISDKLFMRGIPYVYEARLMLDNGKVVFPDFTMLNIKERETYYLEHFGMMDNPEYCKNALEKIDLYEENHIYLGGKLIASFESSHKPINISQIDSMIDRILR